MYSSVGFSLYTDLCNRQQYLIPEHSHHLREALHLLVSPPAPSDHWSFCFVDWTIWTFRVSGTTSSVACRVWLLSRSMMFSRFICVVACISTSCLFKADLYSTAWISHLCLSSYQFVDFGVSFTFCLL